MEKCTSHAQACSLMDERATYAKLWRWISPRMMALALVIVVIFEGGIWYWCEVWEQETRATLPPAVRAEISMLEAQQKRLPVWGYRSGCSIFTVNICTRAIFSRMMCSTSC